MLDPVENRIAERDKIAEEQMRHQGPLHRMLSRIGLTAASATDRVDSIVNNDVTSFAGGAAYGAIQGAFLGGIAWLALLALVPTAAPAFGLFMGASTLAFGLYQGISAVRDHETQKNGVKLSDRIAATSGATPLQEKIREATRQREIDESAIKGTQSYSQILDEQREQRMELGGHHHHR